MASLVAEHGLQSVGSGSVARGPHGMWDLLGPGIEPVSHALAGRFLTTGPPGKSSLCVETQTAPSLFFLVGHLLMMGDTGKLISCIHCHETFMLLFKMLPITSISISWYFPLFCFEKNVKVKIKFNFLLEIRRFFTSF